MPNTIRHCRNCGHQTLHRHMHDCERSLGIYHIHGSERFECIKCRLPTFAWSPDSDRFRFVLDGTERQSVSSHAGARR